MSTKQVVPVNLITTSKVTASNVSESDASEWTSLNNYTAGGQVMVTQTGGNYAATETHKIYEAAQASGPATVVKDPTVAANRPDYWIEVRATNKFRAFDQQIADQTTNATSITYTVVPGAIIDYMGFFNLEAKSITLVGTSASEGEFINQTISLADNSMINGMYSWLFSPLARRKRYVFENIPPYSDATFNITIDAGSGNTAKVGEIVAGKGYHIGYMEWGHEVGSDLYGTFEQDEWGNWNVTGEGNARLLTLRAQILTNRFDAIADFMDRYARTKCMFVGVKRDDGGNLGTLIYGYSLKPRIVSQNGKYSDCKLKIRSV